MILLCSHPPLSRSSHTPLLRLSPSLYPTKNLSKRRKKSDRDSGSHPMASLLHLPDLAAARLPASGSPRGRGRRVVAASAGAGVKLEEAGRGKAGGRVIRVADPVREGRLLQPPPPLFSVPVTPASESPAATRRRDEDEEERRRYYLNLGYAIRTLREEIPNVFYKEPSFDIYRDDIVFQDPFNKFEGIDNYKRIFWGLRFTGRIFFKALWVDIVSIWQPAENLIMIRWIAHGIPRVPWEGHGRFDGASVYKLDKNGKIYEHKVHNIATNPPTKYKVLSVQELIRSIGCPSTPKPTYFEASSQSLSTAPFYLRLAWVRCYISLCHMLSLGNLEG